MKKSAAYLKIVEWSDEDNCFVGSSPPLIGPCCHGQDETKVYRQLCRIVDEWIAVHEQEGRPLPDPQIPPGRKFSGRFMLRIKPQLHKTLAIRSLQAGKSLNSYLVEKLEEVSGNYQVRKD